jgi:hypothetical protein
MVSGRSREQWRFSGRCLRILVISPALFDLRFKSLMQAELYFVNVFFDLNWRDSDVNEDLLSAG